MSNVQITDPYEVSMAHSYLGERMTAPATFNPIVRRLPPGLWDMPARSAADTVAATGVPQRSWP